MLNEKLAYSQQLKNLIQEYIINAFFKCYVSLFVCPIRCRAWSLVPVVNLNPCLCNDLSFNSCSYVLVFLKDTSAKCASFKLKLHQSTQRGCIS